MKKYLISISAAILALVGCMQYEYEVDAPEAVVTTEAPSIVISAIKDSSFVATITPAEGTGFYCYVVLADKYDEEGNVANAPSAANVYKKKVGGLYEGVVDAAVNATTTIEAKNLDPLSTYTVYAIAASTQGQLTDVVSKQVLTPDNTAPIFDEESFETMEKDSVMMFALPFDDRLVVGEGKVTVNLFGQNSPADGDGMIAPEKTYTIDAEDLFVDENYLIVATPKAEYIPGAYVGITFPAGIVKNLSGLANEEAYDTCLAGLNSKGDFATAGLFDQFENVEWDLDYYSEPEVILNMGEAIWFTVPEWVRVSKNDMKATGFIIYENEADGTKFEYTIGNGAPAFGFGWNGGYNCALSYPNVGEAITGRPNPSRGSLVTINIPTFLEDLFGNKNAPFVVGPFLYSYGFTINDVIGTWTVSGTSGFGPTYDEEPWDFVIEESDDAEQGNVMVTSYYGLDCQIYAEFDGDLGVFTMPYYYEPIKVTKDVYPTEDGDLDIAVMWYTYGYYSCAKDMGNDLELYMVTAGEFDDANDYMGYYYEMYLWPESGKLADIDEDEDFCGGDYNIFVPDPVRTSGAKTAAKTAKAASKMMWPTQAKNQKIVRIAK